MSRFWCVCVCGHVCVGVCNKFLLMHLARVWFSFSSGLCVPNIPEQKRVFLCVWWRKHSSWGYLLPRHSIRGLKARQRRQIRKLYDTHALVSPLPQNANWWKFLIWPTGLRQAYRHKIWCTLTHTHTHSHRHTGDVHKEKLEAPTLTDLRGETGYCYECIRHAEADLGARVCGAVMADIWL